MISPKLGVELASVYIQSVWWQVLQGENINWGMMLSCEVLLCFTLVSLFVSFLTF